MRSEMALLATWKIFYTPRRMNHHITLQEVETNDQGVTKRCRLSWLTNSALVSEAKCGEGGSRGLSQWVQLYTGAQINFGDLTTYLTYANDPVLSRLSFFVCDGDMESLLLFYGPSQQRPKCLSSSFIYVPITTKKTRKWGGGIFRRMEGHFPTERWIFFVFLQCGFQHVFLVLLHNVAAHNVNVTGRVCYLT